MSDNLNYYLINSLISHKTLSLLAFIFYYGKWNKNICFDLNLDTVYRSGKEVWHRGVGYRYIIINWTVIML